MRSRIGTGNIEASEAAGDYRAPRWVVVVIASLSLVITVFVVIRLLVDVPHLVAGTVPDDDYSRRYVEHPWAAYMHIAAGAAFLGGAILQLPYRRRRRSYSAHRRRGRILVLAGGLAGAFAVVFGVPRAFGGPGEAAATWLASLWMLTCLALGFVAARRRDILTHRRWMIRAFAIALAVGTIRLWIGVFLASGLLDLRASFTPAFWLAFAMHGAAAEAWLRRYPRPPG